MVGIIFCDLDGTLIDSRKDLANAVNFALKSFSLPPLPDEKVVSYVGNGVKKLIERSFADKAVDLQQALIEMKKYYSAHLLDNTIAYESVPEGLALIKAANFAIVVLTNKMQIEAEQILDGLGILQFFDLIIGDDGIMLLKPSPQAVYFVSKKLALPLQNSWIIGDNWTDIECGINAGIKTAYAAYGFGDIRGMGYDYLAKSFYDFAKMLRGSV